MNIDDFRFYLSFIGLILEIIFPVIFPIIFINPFFMFSWVFIFLFNLIWFFCEGDERYPEERHLGG